MEYICKQNNRLIFLAISDGIAPDLVATSGQGCCLMGHFLDFVAAAQVTRAFAQSLLQLLNLLEN